MARGGRQHRCAAEQVGEPVPEVAAERHQRRPGLLDRLGAGGRRRPPPTTARTSASSAPRASSQARTRDGIALVPLGAHGHPADGGDRAAGGGRLAGGQHGGGQPEHRVVAVHQPGGAGVVGLAVEVQPPPAVRPDAVGDADGGARVDQAAALLDVQLDQGADPAQRLVVAAELLGIVPGSAHRLGQRGAVGVGEPPGPVGVEGAGEQPRPRAGDAEPGALLVGEADDPERPRRDHALLAHQVHGGERADHTERAVVGTTVGHRVQVAAGHDPGAVGVGVAPPGPLVAVAVHHEVQAAPRGLAGEPLAAGQVAGRPGVPAVAAGRAVPADGQQVGPHPVHGRLGHAGHRRWQDHPLARPRSASRDGG